jgi:hypothetical protein
MPDPEQKNATDDAWAQPADSKKLPSQQTLSGPTHAEQAPPPAGGYLTKQRPISLTFSVSRD